jgi:hypothetical protein
MVLYRRRTKVRKRTGEVHPVQPGSSVGPETLLFHSKDLKFILYGSQENIQTLN